MLTLDQPVTEANSVATSDRITAEEAAPIAGMGLQSFYRAIRLGHVPKGVVFHIGRTIRVSRSRLMEWLDAGGSANRAA